MNYVFVHVKIHKCNTSDGRDSAVSMCANRRTCRVKQSVLCVPQLPNSGDLKWNACIPSTFCDILSCSHSISLRYVSIAYALLVPVTTYPPSLGIPIILYLQTLPHKSCHSFDTVKKSSSVVQSAKQSPSHNGGGGASVRELVLPPAPTGVRVGSAVSVLR